MSDFFKFHCYQCKKDFNEISECHHLITIAQNFNNSTINTVQITKNCNKCKTEKSINDFYFYVTGKNKAICKECEIKYQDNELFTCESCQISIRNRNKSKHEKSKHPMQNIFKTPS